MTFEETVEQVDGMIWKIARKYSIKSYTVEDLYQECLMKVLDVYNDYNGTSKLTTYLYTILDNHIKDLCRACNTQSNTNHIIVESDDGKKVLKALRDVNDYNFDLLVTNTNYNEVDAERLEMVYEVIKSHRNKGLLTSLIVYGKTQQAVADELGTTKQNVSKHYRNFINEVKEGVS